MNTDLTNYYFYALGGIVAVFLGLIVIAIVIALFNRLAERPLRKKPIPTAVPKPREAIPLAAIAPEELAAIATALECYRRIHFDQLASQLTFARGPQQSAWKMGINYSQRLNATRKP